MRRYVFLLVALGMLSSAARVETASETVDTLPVIDNPKAKDALVFGYGRQIEWPYVWAIRTSEGAARDTLCLDGIPFSPIRRQYPRGFGAHSDSATVRPMVEIQHRASRQDSTLLSRGYPYEEVFAASVEFFEGQPVVEEVEVLGGLENPPCSFRVHYANVPLTYIHCVREDWTPTSLPLDNQQHSFGEIIDRYHRCIEDGGVLLWGDSYVVSGPPALREKVAADIEHVRAAAHPDIFSFKFLTNPWARKEILRAIGDERGQPVDVDLNSALLRELHRIRREDARKRGGRA